MMTLAFLYVTSVCPAEPTVCFSPGHCDKQVVALIDSAARRLDVAIYSLNRKTIVDALIGAKARGVDVRVVVDRQELAGAKMRSAVGRLVDAGVRGKHNAHSGYMHDKLMVIDGQWIETGSFNFTTHAVVCNDENSLLLCDPTLAGKYEKRFGAMWSSFVAVD